MAGPDEKKAMAPSIHRPRGVFIFHQSPSTKSWKEEDDKDISVIVGHAREREEVRIVGHSSTVADQWDTL